MKNIHILSAGKPSRLYVMNIYKGLRLSKNEIDKSDINTPKNIYITSEEEIKEGDWTIYLGNLVKVASLEGKTFAKEYCKKIILTTDQDLIKDGVQAINDEFLEWFVENPTCEEVEIFKEVDEVDPNICVDYTYNYKIIIPKEEAKQDLEKEMFELEQELNIPSNLRWHNSKPKPKQETLEEITEQIQKDCHKFVESIISKVTYQDATNTFLFMKLAELTLKLKKYE